MMRILSDTVALASSKMGTISLIGSLIFSPSASVPIARSFKTTEDNTKLQKRSQTPFYGHGIICLCVESCVWYNYNTKPPESLAGNFHPPTKLSKLWAIVLQQLKTSVPAPPPLPTPTLTLPCLQRSKYRHEERKQDTYLHSLFWNATFR